LQAEAHCLDIRAALQQLAQHIGASRESVNKALSELAARSIVRLEQKTVVILDIERLKRKSGSSG